VAITTHDPSETAPLMPCIPTPLESLPLSSWTSATEGLVYCIQNSDFINVVKIGFTTRSVEQRIAELSTACPGEFTCLRSVHVCDARAAERHIHLTLGRRYHEAREFYRVGCLDEMHTMFDVLGNTPPDVLREVIQKNDQAPVIVRDGDVAKSCSSDSLVAKSSDMSFKHTNNRQRTQHTYIYGTFMQTGVTPPTPEYLYRTVFHGHDNDEFNVCRDSTSDFSTWSFRIKCAKKQRASHFKTLIEDAERLALVHIFTFEVNRRGERMKHEAAFFAYPGERMLFGGKYGTPMIDYPVYDSPSKESPLSKNHESPGLASESDNDSDYVSDLDHCAATETRERSTVAASAPTPIKRQDGDTALQLLSSMLERKEREIADMRREYEAKLDALHKENDRRLDEQRKENDRKLDEQRKENDRRLDEQRKENDRRLDAMRVMYYRVTRRPM
jgi:hypothetical protein